MTVLERVVGARFAQKSSRRLTSGCVPVAVSICAFGLALLATAGSAMAQNTWLGGTGNWSNATGWSSGMVPSGATPVLIPNGTVTGDTGISNSSTFTIDSSGNLTTSFTFRNMSGGIVNNSGTFLETFELDNDAGATVNNSGTMGIATLFNSGTINNTAGTLTIGPPGSMIFSFNQGTITNSSGASIVVGTGASLTNDGTLTNHGSFSTDDSFENSGSVNSSGTFSATWELQNDASGTLTNSGSMTTGELENFGTILNKSGTLTIGTTELSPGFQSDNNGTITNSAGAQMTVAGTQSLTNEGSFSNAGTFTTQNLFTNAGSINNTGTFSATWDLQNQSGGVITNSGMMTTGPLVNAGAIHNTGGTLTIGSTAINDGSGTFNSGTITNSAGAKIVDTVDLGNSGTVTNAGTFENKASILNTGQITTTGTFNNSGTLSNETGGTFVVESGGTLNNSGAFSTTGGGGLAVEGGGKFNNSGTFTTDYFSGFGTLANSTVVNTGTMVLSGNTVNIAGVLRNNGTIDLQPGPVDPNLLIQPPPPPLLVNTTGTLSGKGTVDAGFLGVGVINDGVMSPGDPGGVFTILGNYQQNASGTLDIRIGGTGAAEFGQLDISVTASLQGDLEVQLFNGFNPQAGETFEFLESGDLALLDFSNLLFPTLNNGLSFQLDREGNDLFLDVVGGNGGNGGGSTNAPEPQTILLLVSGLAAMACVRRRLGKRLES